ncbi:MULTISPECIES: vitamin B12 dependent-methionine synthase activation domain-containing protein [unclassified Saccharicrinis]|uniref:vitamin B12 dependent-methionine synthase activation domain-containing protein n=1 Tax=unclassified Saccharicrinis TaxID=2646859 RepID=UPI003D34767A
MKIESAKRFSFQLEELNISIEDIEELAHMGEDMPSYSCFLKHEINGLKFIASVEGGYIIKNGSVNGEGLLVENIEFKTGKDVSRHYKNSTQLAVFVCTAGEEITERSRALSSKGELVEGYLLDVLGSVIVEKAMDKVQEALRMEMAHMGLKITNRYSPGYCAWDVSEQKSLFSFFPDQFCNVRLSDSCLMHPVKSVSGIIGIGENVKFHKHVCHACSSVNCLYRNTAQH